jgi:hypothetical protein
MGEEKDAGKEEKGKQSSDKEKDSGKGDKGKQPPDDSIVPIPPDLLKQIPKDIRPKIESSVSTFMAEFTGHSAMPNPLLGKITETHISTIIENVEKDDVRQADAAKSTRRYIFAGFLAVVLVAVALVIFLVKEQSTAVLINLIIALFSFAGGFGTGKFFHKEQ